ncbi:Hsp70 protein-domain-containing protein [Sphaerosporella brunnea]|uniref:Hsp70 protein-domain-containing protein n=1 Tax=Sphaerosporella brunnea TaxID=1250544 RepID=A0A5J5ERJ8_9PEZI|nr:Hsp70 protein-domain-containing protein [Sphaerosporella brunnea]
MRSKHLSNTALTSLLVLLLTSYASAASAVLGIDIGQEYIKAALVKPGIPLEIVLTKDTKRKEVSAIGFKPSSTPAKEGEFAFPERLYGADAINLAARFPHDVYPNLKQLLGKLVTNDAVTTYSVRYPALHILPAPVQDTVAFKSHSSMNGLFTVEELLAMQLKAIVAQAQEMAGANNGKIKDVMFTIPSFLLAEEKNALRLAAELAGLKVMGMVSDGLAVGINYATTRTFDEKTPEYHIIYDMGAGSTTASVLRFQGKSVKDVGRFNKTVQEVSVIGVGYDTTLGGDLFNEKMMNLLVEDFIESNKGKQALASTENPVQTLRRNGRAAAKLWREAERARQILSANTEVFSSIESLYNDVDFRSGKLTRAQFEAGIKEYEERITKPIFDALANAKITLDQVGSIILHGGAVRTPFVGKKLEEVVGGPEKISKNVNPDESAVFGATFKGAGESGSFKVKEIRTNDINPYGVTIEYLKSATAEKKTKQQIFAPGSVIGKEKVVTFPQKEDFSFEVVHTLPPRANDPKQRPGMELLWKIDATNTTASVKKLQDDHKCVESAIATKFSLTLSKKDGIPSVSKGWVECEVEVLDKKDGIVDGVKKAFGFGKDKDSSSSSSTSTSTSTAPAETPSLIKKTERIPLAFSVTKTGIPPLSADAKKALKAEIKAFDEHDRTRRLIEESRNELEGFVYKAREQLYDDAFIAASTEEERAKLSAMLEEASEWLYGDGFRAGLDEVRGKLKALKELQKPILRRVQEAEKRPKAVEMLKEAIEQGRVLVNALRDPEAKDQPYDEKEIKELQAKYDAAEKWLEDVLKRQQALGESDDPAVAAKELDEKRLQLDKVVMEVIDRKMQLAREVKDEL